MKKLNTAIIASCLFAFTACSAVADDNLLTNGNFETDLSSWTKFYRIAGKVDASWQSGGASGSLGSADLWYSADYASGARSMNLWQEFSVTPGAAYNAGAYIKADTGGSVGDGYYARLEFAWYDGEYVKKGSSFSGMLSAPNDDWELYSMSGVVSNDAVYGRMILRFYAPADPNTELRQVLFDNAFVTGAPEPVSAALFLLGGTILAVVRKKKV